MALLGLCIPTLGWLSRLEMVSGYINSVRHVSLYVNSSEMRTDL